MRNLSLTTHSRIIYWLKLVHGQVTIIFVVSVCLSVCLCRVFLSRLRSDLDQTRTHVTCPGLVVSPWGLGAPQKTSIFRGFGAAVNHHSVAASYTSCICDRSGRIHRELPASLNRVHRRLLSSTSHRAVLSTTGECHTATESAVLHTVGLCHRRRPLRLEWRKQWWTEPCSLLCQASPTNSSTWSTPGGLFSSRVSSSSITVRKWCR